MDNTENVLEFISGSHTATVTFTSKKHVNRIKSIYKERKDEFKYFVENADGSVCAKIPIKWLKINPGSKEKRVMTDEQKEALRVRFEQARKKRQSK